MFVVAGVSGNTGSVVANELLAAGKKVRVLVRDEAKGAVWKQKGAEVAVAQVEDETSYLKALEGADSLYTLLPPDNSSTAFLERGKHLADVLARVIGRSSLKHVAYLSSIGAQAEFGTGVIRTHFAGEAKLRPLTNVNISFLRAGYFMENLGSLIGAVKGQGVLPAFFNPEVKLTMIATADIGKIATRILLDPPKTTQVLELAGPAEYSFVDAAAAFSKILGKTITPVRVPDEGVVPTLTGFGISEDVAKLYLEMSQGFERGIVVPTDAKLIRGDVTIEAWVRQAVA